MYINSNNNQQQKQWQYMYANNKDLSSRDLHASTCTLEDTKI